MSNNRYLRVLDDLTSMGKIVFETRDVEKLLDLSPQASSNFLTRLTKSGLVDRVKRGHYAIRPIGALGTRAASEDVALAVAAAFNDRPHRIAYRSALEHHGLLQHPARTITVAVDTRTTLPTLSGRPLRLVLEKPERLDVAAVDAGHGAHVSTVERALLESAARPDLSGGIEVVATALSEAAVDVEALTAIAETLRLRAALHRLGSIGEALDLSELSDLEPAAAWGRVVALDPREDEQTDETWHHHKWGVRWPFSVAELEATVRR